jgi:DNA modification methylase
MTTDVINTTAKIRDENKLRPEDRPVHEWYRFVLSFPPHLVREYIQRFGVDPGKRVLDPFCGTATTLVECKKQGIPSVGIEPNPMALFASQVKLDWSINCNLFLEHASEIAEIAIRRLDENGTSDLEELPLLRTETHQASLVPQGLRGLPNDAWELLLKDSISPLPLHKTLVLLDVLREYQDERFSRHERLALAKAIVAGISNLHFGPEVGVGPAKPDAPVVSTWLKRVRAMADDLRQIQGKSDTETVVHRADARQLLKVLEPKSVDVVVTSPPYPNEKDYTRTTRLESVLLGFIRSKRDLRSLKQDLVRSNTRGVYKTDRDDLLVADHDEIQRIAEAIEARRIALGKTSGFERLYARVTKLYFGGMARHLAELRDVLRPGAQLAYVVGDQASYLRVMIRTGQLLADIAESLGYEPTGIDLFRTRLATATKEQIREEVVLLRWPGRRVTRSAVVSRQRAYASIIERIFQTRYKPGMRQVDFEREDIAKAARELGVDVPSNVGDVVYSFRYRAALPESIRIVATPGDAWIIRPAGTAKYRFVLVRDRPLVPNQSMTSTKVPDATPGVVGKYALSDEQALLAKVRYNRLVDIFTGVACYSLQNHLRTTVPELGQVETDELYVGVDKKGAHYVFPVQAKGGRDRLSIVQIEQDLAVCAYKFPSLICRPIAAQFMEGDVIALFEFEENQDSGVGIVSERHYKLVPPEEVTEADLEAYRRRTSD